MYTIPRIARATFFMAFVGGGARIVGFDWKESKKQGIQEER